MSAILDPMADTLHLATKLRREGERAAMKVRVAFTVEVDSAGWQEEYGVPASEVRADVRTYIEQAFLAQLAELGLSGEAQK